MRLWGDATAQAPFNAVRKGIAHLESVERIKDWTRARFALAEDDVILVSEAECVLPGFPSHETVVGFWGGDGTRHHFRVFKRVEGVVEEDLPPRWMKDALAFNEFECSCC